MAMVLLTGWEGAAVAQRDLAADRCRVVVQARMQSPVSKRTLLTGLLGFVCCLLAAAAACTATC